VHPTASAVLSSASDRQGILSSPYRACALDFHSVCACLSLLLSCLSLLQFVRLPGLLGFLVLCWFL
jgi:hypothetical protein